jgi:hypothetical protein
VTAPGRRCWARPPPVLPAFAGALAACERVKTAREALLGA